MPQSSHTVPATPPQGFPWNCAISVETPFAGEMINHVNVAARPARDSSQRRFRIAIIAASVAAALAGSVLLATRDPGEGDDAAYPPPRCRARAPDPVPSAAMRCGSLAAIRETGRGPAARWLELARHPGADTGRRVSSLAHVGERRSPR
jgi:hypothetical protein